MNFLYKFSYRRFERSIENVCDQTSRKCLIFLISVNKTIRLSVNSGKSILILKSEHSNRLSVTFFCWKFLY